MNAPAVSAAPSRVEVAALAVILGLGAWFRFTGLSQGIPFSLGVDEPEIIDRAVLMMRTGRFNPAPFFDYPSLYIYVQAVVAVARFLFGAISGSWETLAQADSAQFYLWGRAVTAALGTATIFVVYRVGRRFGVAAGLLAALLMATQSLHVRESHFVLTDVPMTFFVALTLLISVRAVERGRWTSFLGAGITAGLAAATKYNGGLAILMPFVALLFAGSQNRSLRSFVAVPLGAAAAFLVAAPYTLLELPAFLDAFGRLVNMYSRAGRLAETATVTYLKHLRISMGLTGLLVAGASLAVMTVRLRRGSRSERATVAMLLVFVPAWFLMTADQGGIRYARYLVPLLPGLAVLMGASMAWAVTESSKRLARPALGIAAVVAVLILTVGQPALWSWRFARDQSKTWTTALTYDWLVGNLPAGARVVVETRQILLPPDRFVSANVPRLIERSADDYLEDGVQFLVASSQSFGPFVSETGSGSPEGLAYRALFRRLQLVHHVSPSGDHPGAELRVYRLVP